MVIRLLQNNKGTVALAIIEAVDIIRLLSPINASNIKCR